MPDDPLSPELVAARLEQARALYRPVRVEELDHEPAPPPDLTPETVQARLDAFRDLMRLVEYLGHAEVGAGPGVSEGAAE